MKTLKDDRRFLAIVYSVAICVVFASLLFAGTSCSGDEGDKNDGTEGEGEEGENEGEEGGGEGDGEGNDDDDDDDDSGDGAVSFATDVMPLFQIKCAKCHIATDFGGLKIAYENLVNVPSTQSPLDRVEPGDTAASYLWHKLNGTQAEVGGSGVKMPKGGSLTADELQLIKEWIEQGAKE
ncbi:MAG: hypothetical protein Kow0090_02740 [Myxococcota bacterium]